MFFCLCRHHTYVHCGSYVDAHWTHGLRARGSSHRRKFSYIKGLLSIDRIEMFRARTWNIILRLDDNVVFYVLSIGVRLRVEYIFQLLLRWVIRTCDHSSRSEFMYLMKGRRV